MEKAGRIRIYTDEKEITRENIIPVLQSAYAKHRINMRRMQFLIDYFGGICPLPVNKVVRPEVDVRTVEPTARYIVDFHSGFFWGNPAVYTQRGNKEHHETDSETDNLGISALNEMMLNGLSIGKKNQELAHWTEICGVGYRLVDIKTDWEKGEMPSSYVDLHTLDSLNAFNVYHNGLGQKKVLGVTFVKSTSGKLMFTCFTDKERFEISGWEVTEETINPLGMIPIVEYDRAIDRSGCFECQIGMMDNLNTLVSMFCNDVSQRTMEVWFGSNFELPKDENGNVIELKSGQWLIAQSTQDGRDPKLQPLASTLDGNSTLTGITSMRNEILKKCYVPVATGEGNNSTAGAQTIVSGWAEVEVDACRKELLVCGADREQLELILRAIKFVPTDILPADDPIRKVHASDVDIKYVRSKDYDVSTRVNSYATMVAHGLDGRQALKIANLGNDIEQIYADSKPLIDLYQGHTFGNSAKESGAGQSNDRIMQDTSDQASNSPSIDGMKTDQSRIDMES